MGSNRRRVDVATPTRPARDDPIAVFHDWRRDAKLIPAGAAADADFSPGRARDMPALI
jgi:hypothetical protein